MRSSQLSLRPTAYLFRIDRAKLSLRPTAYLLSTGLTGRRLMQTARPTNSATCGHYSDAGYCHTPSSRFIIVNLLDKHKFAIFLRRDTTHLVFLFNQMLPINQSRILPRTSNILQTLPTPPVVVEAIHYIHHITSFSTILFICLRGLCLINLTLTRT